MHRRDHAASRTGGCRRRHTHCGPSARGEFARTLTMVDYTTNWTVNVTVRNNTKSNIHKAMDRMIPCSCSRSPASTPTRAQSASTTNSSTDSSKRTPSRPAAARPGRMTRPPSNHATTASSENMLSTGATLIMPSANVSKSSSATPTSPN